LADYYRVSAGARAARSILALTLASAGVFAAFAESDLSIGPEDVRIEARSDGGYDLYVRRKPDIASILLTESTKDPAMRADNFAYRSPDYNAVNGDEKRLLNGKALPPANKLYSLLSSTPRPDERFGSAFRVLIPPVLVYGYSWSRSGTVAVGKGTFINIRAFSKPYADYSGAFKDNPYQIRIAARIIPPPQPPAEAPPPAPKPQKESPPPPADDKTSSKLDALIADASGKSLDLVVCLDTTESMTPYIDDLKKNLGPILRERVSSFASFRIGIVLFRDYWPDDYITMKYPFTSDLASFEKTLKGVRVAGGRDIPEAEFEALYAAATEFDWKADRRQIILVTDAPPHPDQRGKIGFADVIAAAGERRIEADAIVEPTSIAPPNPGHPEFENIAKKLALRAANSGAFRLLACAEAAHATPLAAHIEKELGQEIESRGGGIELALPVLAAELGRGDASLLEKARAAGESCVLVASEQRLGSLGETVTRLLDAKNGTELARDVAWKVLAGDATGDAAAAAAIFVNGLRTR
jgi:hypothetical protein